MNYFRRPVSFDDLTPEQRTAACTRNIGNIDDFPERLRQEIKNTPYGAGDMTRLWSLFQRAGEDVCIKYLRDRAAQLRRDFQNSGAVPRDEAVKKAGDGTYASVRRKYT